LAFCFLPPGIPSIRPATRPRAQQCCLDFLFLSSKILQRSEREIEYGCPDPFLNGSSVLGYPIGRRSGRGFRCRNLLLKRWASQSSSNQQVENRGFSFRNTP